MVAEVPAVFIGPLWRLHCGSCNGNAANRQFRNSCDIRTYVTVAGRCFVVPGQTFPDNLYRGFPDALVSALRYATVADTYGDSEELLQLAHARCSHQFASLLTSAKSVGVGFRSLCSKDQ